MRIVIDLQAVQAQHRLRGIGRYAMSLAKSIARQRGDDEVLIALNGQFVDTIEPIRAQFHDLLAPTDIVVWQGCGRVDHMAPHNAWRREVSEQIRQSFLASLKPSIVLVASVFEGLSDDAVVSVRNLDPQVPCAIVLYDLIPHLWPQLYLSNPQVQTWYERRLAEVRQADLILTISNATQRDAVDVLGLPANTVVPISAAVDPWFSPATLSASDRQFLADRYGICREVVMYTGGIDPRKNIEGLIAAFAGLPLAVRSVHTLVVVCQVGAADRQRLETLAADHGMALQEMVITGYVPEADLVALYRACKLFVFPSLYEGFGLPVLEAMSCGAPVISANNSSLPEVIGRADALFDPGDVSSIRQKLLQALTDDIFRQDLAQHARVKAAEFSWERTGQRALEALREKAQTFATARAVTVPGRTRPRLAFVCPMPPLCSETAVNVAKLIPELARFYEIDVVVNQTEVTDASVLANSQVRDCHYFLENAGGYDRVLYHFANNALHAHMFGLVQQVPGIVVLHDFVLSSALSDTQSTLGDSSVWPQSLYLTHGYGALAQWQSSDQRSSLIHKFPSNILALRDAVGVIVHSSLDVSLARQLYGDSMHQAWTVIKPLGIAAEVSPRQRQQARQALGIEEDLFLVVGIGIDDSANLSQRLLDVWLDSPLCDDAACQLAVFVQDGETEAVVISTQNVESAASGRAVLTEQADPDLYANYLCAADVAVHLDSLSSDRTSTVLFECMSHGLPTIVVSNDSARDLPRQAVWTLPAAFENVELRKALESLRTNRSDRMSMGRCARIHTERMHQPEHCALQYWQAIEQSYAHPAVSAQAVSRRVKALEPSAQRLPSNDDLLLAAQAIDATFVPELRHRQFLVDVSELVNQDSKTGIQRVVRSILRQWLLHPPEGFRVEPVYASASSKGYRYARRFTLRFLGVPDDVVGCWGLSDEPVSYAAGDVFLGLDLQPSVVPAQASWLQRMRAQGVRLKFVVYDLLPILLPACFFPGASEHFEKWLRVVACSDGAICISRAVMNELSDWLQSNDLMPGPQESRLPLSLDWFHLGADIEESVPTSGLPADAAEVLNNLNSHISFLMVGTIEPRKAHAQALRAFEQLWAQGSPVNLVIVGKKGWMVDAFIDEMTSHPEYGNRLIWLDSISDEYLVLTYKAASCLLAPTFGEGFGLSLIEAARHGLPILARDLPVFRELELPCMSYFNGLQAEDLSGALLDWLGDPTNLRVPKTSSNLQLVAWRDSASALAAKVCAK